MWKRCTRSPSCCSGKGWTGLSVNHLNLGNGEADMSEWQALVNKVKSLSRKTTVAIVGKYVSLPDAYMSVVESLKHAGFANDTDVQIHWVNSEDVTDENADEWLRDVDGILVPGGFGDRGIEGKIAAIRYARERRIPFFGICLGMQMTCVEGARNLLGLEGAHSTEFDAETPHPIIDLLPEQKDIEDLGGTMRLGLFPCKLLPGSRAQRAYGNGLVYSGTATGTNSTMNIVNNWNGWATASPARRRTAA